MRVRQIRGAYIGRHMEVVDLSGTRVWPPPGRSRPDRLKPSVILGCSRDEADGFVAGYEFAQEALKKAMRPRETAS